ncbi:MAG: superoxide dismutase, Ni [Actinomycetota bacterium]|nr:superoxide dismutase, Ni [Actinomycetota bacterium]
MLSTSRLATILDRFSPPRTAFAHCDLPCGVYDPAQARIEAESVKACMEKFNGSGDAVFRERAVLIKEERAELVKHHLWVLWTDYFKPEHLEKHPELHELFWKATKAAGDSKRTSDTTVADRLLENIGEIDRIFWETKKA